MKTLCLVKQLGDLRFMNLLKSSKLREAVYRNLFLDDKAEDSGKQNSLRRGYDAALKVLQRNA